MSQLHIAPSAGKRWLMLLGVTLVSMFAVTAVLRWPVGGVEPAADRGATGAPTSPQVSPATAAVPAASVGDGLPHGILADQASTMAQQAQAAEAVKRQPVIKPLTGPVTERPDFLSIMEWEMLKSVAQQHADASAQLTRMVNFVRFTKQLELWESLPVQDPRRATLANELLDDLPNRVRHGDMDIKEARSKVAMLAAAAESTDEARARRQGVEQARLDAAAAPR